MPPSTAEREPVALAELDAGTRELIGKAIARAITAELGRVRVSSIAPGPPSEPPRSSMRAAADVAGKVGKSGIKWGVLASGALSLTGSAIVWIMRPEYAAPLAQAAKLIASVILAAFGGGAPAANAAPAREVPALAAPAPDPPP
jgi:hypothetical protein